MSALDFLMDRESNWPGTIRAHDFLGTVEPGIGLSRPPHAVSAAEIVDISENPTPDLYEPRANGEPLGAGQTLRTLGNSLMSSVTHGLPGAWAGMVEGQDYGKTTDWTNNASLATDFQQPGMDISGEKWTPNPVIDALVNRATAHVKANQSPDDAKTGTAIPGITVQNLKNLESNAAFSLANTLATMTMPLHGVTSTFIGAQRSASNQFLREMSDALNAENIKQTGNPLSDEVLAEKLDKLRTSAIKQGLWESGPETAGNLFFGGMLKANAVRPLRGMFMNAFGESLGKSAFAKWVMDSGVKIASGSGKLGAGLAGELATETLTQMGQNQTVHDAKPLVGLANKGSRRDFTDPSDWLESLQEVAPDTVLQTLLTGSVGSLANRAARIDATQKSPQAIVRAEDFLRDGTDVAPTNAGGTPEKGGKKTGGIAGKTTPLEEKQRKIGSVRIDFNGDNILPGLNAEDLEALGKSDKPVQLKKFVIDKNEVAHPDVRREDYAQIIGQSLYSPDAIVPAHDQFPRFNFISRVRDDKSTLVLLELEETKDSYEIVNIHWVGERRRRQKETHVSKPERD